MNVVNSRRARPAVVLSVFAALCRCVFALNPSLDISQYAHTKWTIEDGTLKSRVQAIAQTPDGYLWLGTELGLLRFDGARFLSWEPPKGQSLPSGNIYKLLVSRDGRLWIGTDKGLASWNGSALSTYPELAGQQVNALVEDHEGIIWVGAAKPPGQLCSIQGVNLQCVGGAERFGANINSLYEDNGGNLWVGDSTGMWRWKPGPPERYDVPQVRDFAQDGEGRLIMATSKGMLQLNARKVSMYPPPGGQPATPRTVFRDREGAVWIASYGQGLLRFQGDRADGFARSDGLSGDAVISLFEDREGDLWAGTLDGLDRFRDFAIPKLSLKQGLPADAYAVQAARDGAVWLATIPALVHWTRDQLTLFSKRNGLPGGINSLIEDQDGQLWISTQQVVGKFEQGRFIQATGNSGAYVYAMSGGNHGDIWISTLQNLLHLPAKGAAERIPWTQLGRQDFAFAILPDRSGDGIWLGLFKGGLLYFEGGQIRASYAEADGLGRGLVSYLSRGGDGAIWAATEGGLSRVQNGRIATLNSKNGLPCDTVHWMIEDDDHFYWLYTACGLVRMPRVELQAWVANPKHTVHFTLFEASDGVRLHSQRPSGYSPLVSKAADGRIWFVSGGGVSIIDPRHLPFNNLRPPVHIEKIKADDTEYAVVRGMRLPANVRDVWIDYTALSLVAPEKVHFKYRLEGQDRDWTEVVNVRQVHYSNLSPHHFRFRVMASNNSGVWNEAGDALDFSVDPAYYQTTWFKVLCVAAFLAFLAGVYQLRLQQVARQFNMRLEERVNERTRIARDLHDTLLQSFQGVLLKFHAISFLIPNRPGEAQKTLETAIEEARQAIAEGRDAVQGLRSSAVLTEDIARAITTFGEGLAANTNGHQPAFQVRVEGKPRSLAPVVRDEVYRIAGEGLRNAFRHSRARRIEVDIHYDRRQLRLSVRDDGKGINPQVLDAGGRTGHHGLPGMQERARLVGGKLAIWSEVESGTEIELTISAAIAYARPVAPQAKQED